MADPRLRRRSEQGTGLIGSTAGSAVFLMFLLFGVHIALSASASATVSAVGLDTARRLAGSDTDFRDPMALRAAEAGATVRLRHRLGGMGRAAIVTWRFDGRTVALRIRAQVPGGNGIMSDALGWRAIDRTFRITAEGAR